MQFTSFIENVNITYQFDDKTIVACGKNDKAFRWNISSI